MTVKDLQAIKSKTLAAMVADMSQFLDTNYDSEDFSAQEWDGLHIDMLTVYNVLATIVGAEVDDMLMEAGAVPEVVYEF